MYRILFSSFLSKLDPENAHHLAFVVIRWLPRVAVGAFVRLLTRPHASLGVDTLGLHFDSPFGVAAGFDKDGDAVRGLWQLGFGHIEVGTITALAQPGNDRPRLFRLVSDRAVINRMGFNNRGAVDAAPRLRALAARSSGPIIGVNIGKSRVVDVDDAIDDYLTSARLLAPSADYLAVNVSSPNTPGLRGLQSTEKLSPLLTAVRDAASGTPVLVKIAPDLSDTDIVEISQLAVQLGLAGIIATNTTISRAGLRAPRELVESIGPGGLSGAPLAERSIAVLQLIRTVVPTSFCVISVGGVETAKDVLERLLNGATLVQGYTAFLYRGPLWAWQINRGLRKNALSA
ncbi:MAG: quinone-dependent dihydroorotate dehydrogenase [Lacisediminihabitans sp.]